MNFEFIFILSSYQHLDISNLICPKLKSWPSFHSFLHTRHGNSILCTPWCTCSDQKHPFFTTPILTVTNPGGSPSKYIQNLTTSPHFHHYSPSLNGHHLLARFPALTFPTSHYCLFSTKQSSDAFKTCQIMLLLCSKPSNCSLSHLLNLLKWPTWSGSLLLLWTLNNSPCPIPATSVSFLSSNMPSTNLLWEFCINCSLCLKPFPRGTHIALLFQSMLKCHLVTLFEIATPPLTPCAPYLSVTHLTFPHST